MNLLEIKRYKLNPYWITVNLAIFYSPDECMPARLKCNIFSFLCLHFLAIIFFNSFIFSSNAISSTVCSTFSSWFVLWRGTWNEIWMYDFNKLQFLYIFLIFLLALKESKVVMLMLDYFQIYIEGWKNIKPQTLGLYLRMKYMNI